jgi:Polyketide cyclase / dehydrase and lipid transport
MRILRIPHALTLAFCLVSQFALAQALLPIDAQDESDIVVRAEKNGETIVIDVDMPVHAAVAAVWDVFTDYDHMAQFISSVNSSRITDRNGNTLVVAQKSSTSFGLLKFSFDNVREVELFPHREIHSKLISGDMKESAFTTRLVNDGLGVTRVINHGVFIPTMWVPPVIGTAFLESQTRRQFFELRNEIIRRGAEPKVAIPLVQ